MRYNIKFQDIVKKLNQNSKYLFMVSYYKSEYTINIINSDNEIILSFINENHRYNIIKLLIDCNPYITYTVVIPTEYSQSLINTMKSNSILQRQLMSDTMIHILVAKYITQNLSIFKTDKKENKKEDKNTSIKQIWYDMNNTTWCNLSNELRDSGCRNYTFLLKTIDKNDNTNLYEQYKNNIWYFMREVVKINHISITDILVLYFYSLGYNINIQTCASFSILNSISKYCLHTEVLAYLVLYDCIYHKKLYINPNGIIQLDKMIHSCLTEKYDTISQLCNLNELMSELNSHHGQYINIIKEDKNSNVYTPKIFNKLFDLTLESLNQLFPDKTISILL